MKKLIKYAKTDTSKKWVNIRDLEDYTQMILDQCILAIETANASSAGTSYDQGLVSRTVFQSINAIKQLALEE
jgi:hypothetical protein